MSSQVLQELNKIGKLALQYREDLSNPKLFLALDRKFQGSYEKVFELLHNHSIKKYVFQPSGKIVWIVTGRERDYLIYPESPYCHCTNFYIHVINGQAKVCTHLVAQRIAQVLNMYTVVEESDKIFNSLMEEWKKTGNGHD